MYPSKDFNEALHTAQLKKLKEHFVQIWKMMMMTMMKLGIGQPGIFFVVDDDNDDDDDDDVHHDVEDDDDVDDVKHGQAGCLLRG